MMIHWDTPDVKDQWFIHIIETAFERIKPDVGKAPPLVSQDRERAIKEVITLLNRHTLPLLWGNHTYTLTHFFSEVITQNTKHKARHIDAASHLQGRSQTQSVWVCIGVLCVNCNGIEELCTQEPNISRRCELILRPGAVDCCFASCPNPILDPKLLFSQVLQAANFGADSGWQPPKTAFFAFANPWPNKPESAHFSCLTE